MFTRKNTDDRTTEQRENDFLKAFADVGIIAWACKQARVSRSFPYDRMVKSSAFTEAFHAAEVTATENMEIEAHRRAVRGVKKRKGIWVKDQRVGEEVVTEYSDVLLMFVLKKRDPSYRDRPNEINVAVGTTTAPKLDLKNLNDEELAEYERLLTKATGK